MRGAGLEEVQTDAADSRAPDAVAISSPQLLVEDPKVKTVWELPGPAGGRGCSVPGRPPAQKPLRDREVSSLQPPHSWAQELQCAALQASQAEDVNQLAAVTDSPGA